MNCTEPTIEDAFAYNTRLLREAISEALKLAMSQDFPTSDFRSRELSLTITKLEEAEMWAARVERV